MQSNREHNRPRRGAGFDNPERDYGPPDQISGVGHIDARRKPRWRPPAEAVRQNSTIYAGQPYVLGKL